MMKASDTPMVAHSLYHAVQNHRIPAWSITPLMVEESRRLGKVIIQDSNDTYYHRVGEILEHNKIHPSNFKKRVISTKFTHQRANLFVQVSMSVRMIVLGSLKRRRCFSYFGPNIVFSFRCSLLFLFLLVLLPFFSFSDPMQDPCKCAGSERVGRWFPIFRFPLLPLTPFGMVVLLHIPALRGPLR